MSYCSNRRAPARRLARAGALAVLAPALVAIAACEAVPGTDGPRVIELANDTIRLEEGVTLVEIVARRSDDGDFDPASAQAQTGDVVQFTAGDNGGHAIVFESTALAADAREFMERTMQMRSPPLIEDGSSWVVTLEGAPAGEYPFRCTTHNTSGRLSVAAR